jgi:hypothetical protein
MQRARLGFLGVFAVVTALCAWSAGCGSQNNDGSRFAPMPDGAASGGAGVDGSPGSSGGSDASLNFSLDGSTKDGDNITATDAQGAPVVSPAMQTITVTMGQTPPTAMLSATLGGLPVTVGWSVDRGDVGTVGTGPSSTATFTPTGTTGGIVTVSAGYNGFVGTAQILVKITGTQNGSNTGDPGEMTQIATSVGQLTSEGGVGGVGGDGLGGAETNGPTLAALANPSVPGASPGGSGDAGAGGDGSTDAGGDSGEAGGASAPLSWLYPYDQTVWPRGMLAPLLQWTGGPGDADAIRITLTTTSGSFSWSGTFSRPTILSTTGTPFVNHPIPQDVWAAATNTAGGTTSTGTTDRLTVNLTIAKAGTGYGPIAETWTIAPGRLPGIIYYNSYGTQLAQNSTGAVGGNGSFGGAVLSIKVGDTGPQLVAGTNGSSAQCRVCHSVAAQGARLVVQHGDNNDDTSSAYDLTPTGSVEHVMTHNATYPGVYPDGTLALTENGLLLPIPNDTTPVATTGLTSVVSDLGTPSFSPDGKLIAFNPMAGSGVTTPGQQIMVMGFDLGSSTFSGPTLVVDDTGQPAQTRPGWPAFFPDGKSLVFHHQSVAGGDGNGWSDLATRKGCKAQIAWTSAADATHVTALNALNGLDANGNSYLPKLAQPINMTCTGDGQQVGGINPDHADDVDLNYEPTVNPLASGGYVWVVFTSRRMYGTVADIPPFCSDPRGVDLIKNVTPKKLWVAAVDLGATPGTDASHPAFYLPGQELLAGNSRAFWVQEPCHADGQSCQSGDQCCNGYCEPEGDGGALICANAPPNNACSMTSDKCVSAADCCDKSDECINGFCAQASPTPQ